MTATTITPTRSLRAPALVGGFGILVLAALSGWAIFGVVEGLVTDGDAARTATDILAASTMFRFGVLALVLTALLDIVVGWALWAFFAPVRPTAAAVSGALRAVYGVVFLAAIGQLAAALNVLTSAASVTTQMQVEALHRIENFHLVFDVGLALFGLHLVITGYLVCRADYAPRLLGWLLAFAGLGYIFDSGVALLASGAVPELAMVTFVGEVWLFVWLLVKGRHVILDGQEVDR
jgi:hypothetical protein